MPAYIVRAGTAVLEQHAAGVGPVDPPGRTGVEEDPPQAVGEADRDELDNVLGRRGSVRQPQRFIVASPMLSGRSGGSSSA